jgi:hypothetical protein
MGRGANFCSSTIFVPAPQFFYLFKFIPIVRGTKLKYSPTEREFFSFHTEIFILNRMFNEASLSVLVLELLYGYVNVYLRFKSYRSIYRQSG